MCIEFFLFEIIDTFDIKVLLNDSSLKKNITFIILLLSIYFGYSQDINDLRSIDSLKSFVLNTKTTDSLKFAKYYYLIGDKYRKTTSFTDSSFVYYRKAEKIYRIIKDELMLARSLYGIAVILKNEKEFTESEVTCVQVLQILDELPNSIEVIELKSFVYNNLGIVFKELDDFEESVKYHKKSLELKSNYNVRNKEHVINYSLNNIGNTYKKAGQYDLAISHYNQALSNKILVKKYPYFYSLVLDNFAHTLFLSRNLERIPYLYLRALKVSDSISYEGYNSIIMNQHLAEYYNSYNLKDSAKFYAYRAKRISEKYHNDDLLKSLLLLSKIEEGEKSAEHLKAYVKLNDSLQKEERKVRNKFARIRFETDQLEEENIKIAKERMWLLIVSTVLIMAFFLLYLVIRQRVKNKELEFVQKQQETNEEIYNLMLSQSDTIEEARTLEKKRISEELHDGVLGRLFGTRLSLDSLNFNNTPEAVKTRGEYIDSLKNIEEDIRKVSHELNTDFIAGAGFRDIIKTLVETQSSAYKLKHSLEHDDSINWDLFSNKTKIHIYRIIQESLHNIYKHAKASSVNIGFKPKNNVICLQVQDNGVGFDVNKAKSGIGLKNMKSRINEINGEFNLSSSKQEGTIVSIEIPLA